MSATERKPVDVRAKLDAILANPMPKASQIAEWKADIYQVRDAVTELLEATIEFRACLAALVIWQEQEGPGDIYEELSARYLKADTRCDAALARAQGGAA